MWVSVFIAGVRLPLLLEVAAGLPPNRFRDRRYFGSAAPSSVRCCMLRLELLRLLRKWLGTEVLVVGILTIDFGSRRKELMRRLGYGICVLR
ncbi:uncharacterized protein DS421_6g185680 [Arachis hypogaea]|nr:uncharacterized protein DS421_6g185680 [Arachis hypogaea]